VLPESYGLADVVANIQSAALLGLAFAQGRGDLLRLAMKDRVHQPYRASICPLLPHLLPLAGHHGILGAALSGAGPAVLMVVDGEGRLAEATDAIQSTLVRVLEPELAICRFVFNGARQFLEETRD
jgi:homoserine kinase